MPLGTQHRALSSLPDPLSHSRSCELVRLRGGGIDDPRHLEHAIRRKSSEPGVLANYVGVWSDVDTGDLVLGHIALHPLDAGTAILQHRARALRDALEIRARDGRGVRYLALDDVFRHWTSPVWFFIALVVRHHHDLTCVRAVNSWVPVRENAARVVLPYPRVQTPELKNVVSDE